MPGILHFFDMHYVIICACGQRKPTLPTSLAFSWPETQNHLSSSAAKVPAAVAVGPSPGSCCLGQNQNEKSLLVTYQARLSSRPGAKNIYGHGFYAPVYMGTIQLLGTRLPYAKEDKLPHAACMKRAHQMPAVLHLMTPLCNNSVF